MINTENPLSSITDPSLANASGSMGTVNLNSKSTSKNTGKADKANIREILIIKMKTGQLTKAVWVLYSTFHSFKPSALLDCPRIIRNIMFNVKIKHEKIVFLTLTLKIIRNNA